MHFLVMLLKHTLLLLLGGFIFAWVFRCLNAARGLVEQSTLAKLTLDASVLRCKGRWGMNNSVRAAACHRRPIAWSTAAVRPSLLWAPRRESLRSLGQAQWNENEIAPGSGVYTCCRLGEKRVHLLWNPKVNQHVEWDERLLHSKVDHIPTFHWELLWSRNNLIYYVLRWSKNQWLLSF